jgi:hypothetical protein
MTTPDAERTTSTPLKTVEEVQKALGALSDTALTREHYEEYLKQAHSETNDRGAAIIISTNLENVLQAALENRLQVGPKRPDLFRFSGPLGTFDNKIKMGEALKIFGSQTKKSLMMIKDIRNAFAHAKIPIGFTNPAVLAACRYLMIPQLLPPVSRPSDWKPETQEQLDAIQGKLRFSRVCDDIAHNLLILTLSKPSKIPVDSIDTEEGNVFVKHRDVWVVQKPLP